MTEYFYLTFRASTELDPSHFTENNLPLRHCFESKVATPNFLNQRPQVLYKELYQRIEKQSVIKEHPATAT